MAKSVSQNTAPSSSGFPALGFTGSPETPRAPQTSQARGRGEGADDVGELGIGRGVAFSEVRWACVPARRSKHLGMKNFTTVVERDPVTGLLIGYVPGFPGAHSQAESLDELNANLREVVAMLLEDGEPKLEAEFVGTQSVAVA
jgi:predicted RNase H-like HicB family nuclease